MKQEGVDGILSSYPCKVLQIFFHPVDRMAHAIDTDIVVEICVAIKKREQVIACILIIMRVFVRLEGNSVSF